MTKKLRKQIMSIETDSTPLEDPKDWKTMQLLRTLYNYHSFGKLKLNTMKANYENGGYGYGHAKQALYELIIEKFADTTRTLQSLHV